MAARVDETSADLVAGDTTVSMVQFATRARRLPGLRRPQAAQRPRGRRQVRRLPAERWRPPTARASTPPSPGRSASTPTTSQALEQAAKHLPADAVRPALILFTDGKHDVAGVPASRVPPTIDRLFGSRSPIAILPVGMGLDGQGPRRARGRPQPDADHQGHARLRQRGDVRLAADRVRDGRRGRDRRRRRAPGGHLHVHGRPPAHARHRPRRRASRRSAASRSSAATARSRCRGALPPPPPARRRSSTTRSAAAPARATGSKSTEGESLDRTTVVEGLTNGIRVPVRGRRDRARLARVRGRRRP